MTDLLAVKGPLCGTRYPLGNKTTLGRSSECGIDLMDSEVSRIHAEIVSQRHGFILNDLNSRNGTYVNGRKVARHILLRNDEIHIGSSVLIFDPDFDLQNSRYSGAAVYVSPPHDETLEVKKESGRDTAPPMDDKGMALVRQLADLFSQTENELPALLNSLLSRIIRMFHAERGFIMLWDPVLKELQTVVTMSPDKKQIVVSRKIIQATFYEKTALLSSGGDEDYPYAEDADLVPHSSVSAPLLLEGRALGIVYMDRQGADHYDLRSLGLLQSIARLIAHSIEQTRFVENILLKTTRQMEEELIGNSPSIQDLRKEVIRLAEFDASVLIMGETGTGKELVARALHQEGPRKDYPFIVVNCTAIPETLFESELFGHEKGAFTGAISLQRGKIELAHGGTLFLDEVGDLKLSLQPKLLRFLQEKNFYRIGGKSSVRVDVRIVAATNMDLRKMVKDGRFREDLFYRLSVVSLAIQPLRERAGDIRLIAEHYLRFYSQKLKKKALSFSDEALIKLEKYPWPGNVRELMNTLERAVILCPGKVIQPERLALEIPEVETGTPFSPSSHPPLEDVEKQYILRVLKDCEGNQVQAAKVLGIHRNTLHKKLLDYNLF
ncbi:sigma 54-interacting transcriptional regulator [Candidatus Sumerlaeota bacterium]|nr:sigma 54-interacting transcriptional regulator [Candidatus Sumerlaeota bacterium]